jgi:hypothetical protein
MSEENTPNQTPGDYGWLPSATDRLWASDDVLAEDDIEAYNAEILAKLADARAAEANARAEAAAKAGAEALARQQAALVAQQQAAAGFAAGNRTPAGAAAYIEQAASTATTEAEYLAALAAADLVESQASE